MPGPVAPSIEWYLANYTGELAAAVVALIVLWLFVRFVRRRRRRPLVDLPDLTIDLGPLGNPAPPHEGPTLECFNLPMRLVVVVMAPLGRESELPYSGDLTHLADQLVPGLAQVVAAHRPILKPWPPQLSSEGFRHAFFANVRLPGAGGKGTCWCSLSGRFAIEETTVMVGLALCAEKPNRISQVVVENEYEWLKLLNVVM